MRTTNLRRIGPVLFLFIVPLAAQNTGVGSASGPLPTNIGSAAAGKVLNEELKQSWGVVVNEPKVYDDALLRDLLAAASSRLAAISGALDATKVNAALGALSGATLSASGFGLSIGGSPLHGVVTTNKGPTSSTETTGSQNVTTASQYPGQTDASGSKVVTTLPTTDVQTTRAPLTAPSIAAPPAGLSLPTTAGPSASDLLNEQMQLLNEIANLRLLLDGALNDQIVQVMKDGKPTNQRIVKKRFTIGIPVTLAPTKQAKDRVTVVEVLARSPEADSFGKIPPAITALLPKDKTYNTASITDRNFSLAGSAVMGVLGASASYTRSKRTWFVVAAQDTVALRLNSTEERVTRFAWQLRPVLGQRYLRAGMRELMVQLAPATNAGASFPVSLQVRTYLREYDQKTGLVGKVIEDSVTAWSQHKIPNIELRQSGRIEKLEDLGTGEVLVNIQGRFLNGTYVRVGSRRIAEGAGLSFESGRMRFVATRLELAKREVRIVSRDGTEEPVTLGDCPKSTVAKPERAALGESAQRLTIELPADHKNEKGRMYALLADESAYGTVPLSDGRLYADVPTDILKAKPRMRLQALLQPGCSIALETPVIPDKSKPLELQTISQGPTGAQFVLTGSDAATATLVLPGELSFSAVGSEKVLVLNQTQIGLVKSIVVKPDAAKPTVRLAVPQPPEREPWWSSVGPASGASAAAPIQVEGIVVARPVPVPPRPPVK